MRINVNYNDVRSLIQEADVLLFRKQPNSFISKMISVSGATPYVHVALASWHNGVKSKSQGGILECCEFRENIGGRTSNLSVQVQQHSGLIDVYRIERTFGWHKYNAEKRMVENGYAYFTNLDAKKITSEMRKMTGLPYGWRRIWWMAKYKMAGFRLFYDYDSLMTDTFEDLIYPVCSTATSYCFSKHGFDLVHNKSDNWMEPADFARSAKLSYVFTLSA